MTIFLAISDVFCYDKNNIRDIQIFRRFNDGKDVV